MNKDINKMLKLIGVCGLTIMCHSAFAQDPLALPTEPFNAPQRTAGDETALAKIEEIKENLADIEAGLEDVHEDLQDESMSPELQQRIKGVLDQIDNAQKRMEERRDRWQQGYKMWGTEGKKYRDARKMGKRSKRLSDVIRTIDSIIKEPSLDQKLRGDLQMLRDRLENFRAEREQMRNWGKERMNERRGDWNRGRWGNN